jgi:tRNA (guanine37-N1)-methyltransferase
MQELSVGPFVLTGGELPAMILIDCMSRQVEGVLGNFDSREEERSGHQTASSDVYTRPEIFEWLNHFDKNGRPISKADLGKGKKYKVPKVLLSGDHKKIEEWRKSH